VRAAGVLAKGRMFDMPVLKHIVEGRIEGKGKRVRRRKQLLDNLKQKRRY
jgi:hypothetical protein